MLRNRSNEPVSLVINDAKFQRTMAYLLAISKAGEKATASALNVIAFRWHREIVRHIPVDDGIAKSSVAVAPAIADGSGMVRAAVGSNVPYVVFLEFGNWYRDRRRAIAKGAVQDWRPGDPPILDWAAKRGEATGRTTIGIDQGGGAAGRGRNTKGQFTSSKSADRAEFMPPFRGSWQVIADWAIQTLRKKLAKLMQAGKISGGGDA